MAISLIVVALAGWVTNDLSNTAKFSNAAQYDSDLRSAVELGIQNIRYNALGASTTPSECWSSPTGESTWTNPTGYSISVFCATVSTLNTPSWTRQVTVDACLSSNLSAAAAAAACYSNPALKSVVEFNDNLATILTSTCTPGACGGIAKTVYWSYGSGGGVLPSPSTTTSTLAGATTTSSSTTSTTSTTPTSTTSTTSTTTTTTAATTTSTSPPNQLVILTQQPQFFTSSSVNAGTTSGSLVIQSQTAAGAPFVQPSDLSVNLKLNFTTGSITDLSGFNDPLTMTIPQGQSWGIVNFSTTSNGSGGIVTFTVQPSAPNYTSTSVGSETVEPDAGQSSTTVGPITALPSSITSSGANVQFTVPVANTFGRTTYYTISVGGLLSDESVSGPGLNCFSANSSANPTVTVSTSATRYPVPTSATLEFFITRYTDSSCSTVRGTDFYQGNITLAG